MNTVREFSGLLLAIASLGVSSCSQGVTAGFSQELPTSETISATSIEVNLPDSTCSVLESADYSDIHKQRKQFAIPESVFNQLTDEAFHAQYPELNGRSLTCDEGDAKWRSHWLDIADELLNQLELLSPDVRQKLGLYHINDYNHWRHELTYYPFSEKAFITLVDARFKTLFPQYSGIDLNPRGAGQLWYAVASEAIESINSGESLEIINLPISDFSRNYHQSFQNRIFNGATTCWQDRCTLERSHLLKAASSTAYSIPLERGMTLTISERFPSFINLIVLGPEDEILLPSSSITNWSQEISKSGSYKVLVTSKNVADTQHSLVLEVTK